MAKALRHYATAAGSDVLRFFEVLIFSFITVSSLHLHIRISSDRLTATLSLDSKEKKVNVKIDIQSIKHYLTPWPIMLRIQLDVQNI